MKLQDFKLEVFFGEHEFSAPYLLTQSDCETMSIQELLALEPGATEEYLNHHLGYTEVEGTPRLREAIAKLYPSLKPENVVVHAGAQEAIFNLMNILLTPDDHVICQFPVYQSLFSVGEAIGAEVSYWRLQPTETGWAVDLDELAQMIQPNTKLIIVNSPNNPTGFTLTQEEMERIVELAKPQGITVLCDEVYQGLEHDGVKRPAMVELYDKGISIGVMSKAYGLAGLRVGWLATNDLSLVDRLLKMKHYTSICSSGPSEYLASVALKHGDELLERSKRLIEENLETAKAFFARYPEVFQFREPMAGPIAFVEYKKGSVEQFTRDLIEKKGVLLLPASLYDIEGPYFRMGFGRKDFPVGLGHLEDYLKESGY